MLNLREKNRQLITEQDYHDYFARHWCGVSEHYAGCDALLTRIDQGWSVNLIVLCEQVVFGEGRFTMVYHFTLQNTNLRRSQQRSCHMSVIANPMLDRLLKQIGVQVMPLYQGDACATTG